MSYLLDTNVVSELVRPGANSQVLKWIDSVPEEQAFISVITVAEIRKGVASLPSGRRRDVLDEWLSFDLVERFQGRIMDVTIEIADVWGRLAGQAKAGGFAFAVMDGLIAATAVAHSMVVATRNTRNFAGHGVSLVDPWSVE